MLPRAAMPSAHSEELTDIRNSWSYVPKASYIGPSHAGHDTAEQAGIRVGHFIPAQVFQDFHAGRLSSSQPGVNNTDQQFDSIFAS